jgi:hypothetical protein
MHLSSPTRQPDVGRVIFQHELQNMLRRHTRTVAEPMVLKPDAARTRARGLTCRIEQIKNGDLSDKTQGGYR